jgi:hypothetical protein
MNYYTRFYGECPATEVEFEIEIIFSYDEEESRESFWGYPVAVPTSNEIEILEVFKNGEQWIDYPSFITNKIHDEEWMPCQYVKPRKGQRNITKSISLKPCKKRLAA